MSTIQGPGIFLAQFLRDAPPFNDIRTLAPWAAKLGYRAVQIPTWDRRVFDLESAAASQDWCDDYRGMLAAHGLVVSELCSALQGQVLAVHPAYERLFEAFHPPGLSGTSRTAWAQDQLRKSVVAAGRLGVKTIPVLSGGFAWHLAYPWPQRPQGLIDEAFAELARRWRGPLDAASDAGITFAFELHPGSDLFDGATFEAFLARVDDHPAACLNYDASHFVLQQLDYLQFIELYGSRIRGFHVKDAEFRPNGRVGVYGGYQPWAGRAGRFRSPGDGQVDFKRVFTLLTEAGYRGWAVLEWECAVKSPEQGAAEGAPFIVRHLIDATDVAFDDFAGRDTNPQRNRARFWASTQRSHDRADPKTPDGNGRRRPSAFIGAVHRMAAALDQQIELVAGCFSRDPQNTRVTGRQLGLAQDRCYDTFEQMAAAEARLPDEQRFDFVSIVTPTVSHFPIAAVFLRAGFHVVCDKPMAFSLAEARELVAMVEKSGLVFALTHNYTGYPLVRHARHLCRSGRIGQVRKVIVEYLQDFLAFPHEKHGQKQAMCQRVDPRRSDPPGPCSKPAFTV